MKLRIYQQSLRFRLSQADVDNFIKFGELKEVVKLSSSPDGSMTISLTKGATSSVEWKNGSLHIQVADHCCKNFADSDVITFQNSIDVGDGNALQILVEKDFACVKPHSPQPLC